MEKGFQTVESENVCNSIVRALRIESHEYCKLCSPESSLFVNCNRGNIIPDTLKK